MHCKRIIPLGSKEILEGCQNCSGHFFFYVRDEQLQEAREKPIEIPEQDKKKVEKDIREMAGITEESAPVILDLEAVRAIGDGKFEIDIINLFRKGRPLIYKLEEGKYIIDLATTLKKDVQDINSVRNPDKKE